MIHSEGGEAGAAGRERDPDRVRRKHPRPRRRQLEVVVQVPVVDLLRQSRRLGREEAEQSQIGRGLRSAEHGPAERGKVGAEVRGVVHHPARRPRERPIHHPVPLGFGEELPALHQRVHAVVREHHRSDPGGEQHPGPARVPERSAPAERRTAASAIGGTHALA